MTLTIGGIPAQLWLESRCRAIDRIAAGFVCSSSSGEDLKVVAAWPGDSVPSLAALADARASLDAGSPILRRFDPDPRSAARGRVTAPLAESSLRAAVVLEMEDNAGLALEALSRDLASGGRAESERADLEKSRSDRLHSVLRWVALCLEHDDYRAAGVAVATELATALRCERVSIGFYHAGGMRVEAISHSARFDRRTILVRDIAAAMEEAAEQDTVVAIPSPANSRVFVSIAHEQLIAEHGERALCTVPIARDGSIVGAILFERESGCAFDGSTVRLLEDAVSILGIALWTQRHAATGPLKRILERARTELAALSRPGANQRRIAAGALLAVASALVFAPVPYDVKADATLEGRVQRALVAQVDGFVAEANARAGDVVGRGQTIAVLDDRDFQVERSRSLARREELRVEYFQALSHHDKSRAHAVAAQIAQADAQIRLVDERLSRTRLVAPFDGVIVQGDLSQSLGSPVSRGDLLFEIAPLDGYRVILKIDERDVRDVDAGRPGTLRLSALPGDTIPLTVERVTPVAIAEEGRNYFRAEARLEHPPDALRPGMQGMARIAAQRRSLLWIWTHDVIDYVRLFLWSWF